MNENQMVGDKFEYLQYHCHQSNATELNHHDRIGADEAFANQLDSYCFACRAELNQPDENYH